MQEDALKLFLIYQVTVVVLHLLLILWVISTGNQFLDRIVNGFEFTCYTNPNIPRFLKTLNETTTDNIDMRVCSNQGVPEEGISLDIYVICYNICSVILFTITNMTIFYLQQTKTIIIITINLKLPKYTLILWKYVYSLEAQS